MARSTACGATGRPSTPWPPAATSASRANNLGIRATTSDLVLLLNPDTVVEAGQLDRLVEGLRADEGAAAAGPRLVDGDGRPELSFAAADLPGANSGSAG